MQSTIYAMFGDLNLFAIFTTGLLVGGISCLAVQGGLLASILAQQEQDKLVHGTKINNFIPVTSFLLAKLIAYTILGAFLGWLGSQVALSSKAHLTLQFAIIIFLVGNALNLLNVHPIFRYFVIQPPRSLTRFIWKFSKRHPHSASSFAKATDDRKASRGRDLFAPAVLGVFTVFIPCGATQAAMALAISSGSPIAGSAILFFFILGTSPLFFILGYFAMRAGDLLKAQFAKVAAAVLLLLAAFTLNGALTLTGTQYTFTNFVNNAYCVVSYCSQDVYGQPVTDQTILITPTGYSPSRFAIPAGQQVTIRLVNTGSFGCQQSFTIPSLNIQKIVPPNQSETVTFTAPAQPTTISFMCSMGMYPGVIKVM